jgi:D-alanine-D-alanine ligase
LRDLRHTQTLSRVARSRRLLQASGLRVPQFVELQPGKRIRFFHKPPFMVKPASLAGSTGIYADSVTMDADDVPRLAKRIWNRFSVSALCEEFIVGRELRVGMVEGRRGRFESTGIFESFLSADKRGWGFRTDAIRNNPRVARSNNAVQRRISRPPHLVEALIDASRRAMELLDVSGYATLDFRVDASGTPVILEVNANPGLIACSFWGGRSFSTTLNYIVESAIRRNQKN